MKLIEEDYNEDNFEELMNQEFNEDYYSEQDESESELQKYVK
jgi:hypothetical protein